MAGINSRVQLYEWNLLKDGSRGLVAGAGQSGLVLALYLACRGDFIVVGKLAHWHKDSAVLSAGIATTGKHVYNSLS